MTFIFSLYILASLPLILSRIYGGTFLGLSGKDSVILACDSRFSSQQTGPFLIGEHKRAVLRIGSTSLVGCYGLDADAYSLKDYLIEKLQHFKPSIDSVQSDVIARLVSGFLYESNVICSPIIVGYSNSHGPYVGGLDGLGAITSSKTFVVAGTAAKGIYAILESIYQSDLDSEELVAVAETAFKLAMQRDVLSGCSVRIFSITKSGIFEKIIHTDDV